MKIWCEVYGAVIDRRMMYRPVVKIEGEHTWKGKWTDNKLLATRQAEAEAERIYDRNIRVLPLRGIGRAWPAVYRPGTVSNAADRPADGPTMLQ